MLGGVHVGLTSATKGGPRKLGTEAEPKKDEGGGDVMYETQKRLNNLQNSNKKQQNSGSGKLPK